MGEDPTTVYATASSFMSAKAGSADDTAVIALAFPRYSPCAQGEYCIADVVQSGGLCLIDNSRRTTYGYDVRMEVRLD